jgi:hypothetical protein
MQSKIKKTVFSFLFLVTACGRAEVTQDPVIVPEQVRVQDQGRAGSEAQQAEAPAPGLDLGPIRALSREDIQAIPSEDIPFLSVEQMGEFSSEQFLWFTPEQIRVLTGDQFLKRVADMSHFNLEQFTALYSAACSFEFQMSSNESELLRSQVRSFAKASEKYLLGHTKINQDFATWQKQFASYQMTENSRKSEIRQALDKVHSARLSSELLAPLLRMRDLGMSEGAEASQVILGVDRLIAEVKNGTGYYLLALKPLAPFMEKYQVKRVVSPRAMQERMVGLKQYIEERSKSISGQAKKTVAEIELQINQLNVDYVDKFVKAVEKKSF